MIELEGRGFAQLATVLSFIADCRAHRDRSVRTGGHRPQIETEFSKAIDCASPMTAFVNSIRNPADTAILTGRLTCHMTKCSREIGLAGEVECECNFDQGLISS